MNSSQDHFGLQQQKKKNCESEHGTWGPQKAYFQAYIIHCHGPTSFAVGDANEILSLQMSMNHDREMLFIYINRPKEFIITRKEEGEKLKFLDI